MCYICFKIKLCKCETGMLWNPLLGSCLGPLSTWGTRMCEIVLNRVRCESILTVTYLWIYLIHNNGYFALEFVTMMPGDTRAKKVAIAADATVGKCQNCSVLHQVWSQFCYWSWIKCFAREDKCDIFRYYECLGNLLLMANFRCVAEFGRICIVSFGTETEDQIVRVSCNTVAVVL